MTPYSTVVIISTVIGIIAWVIFIVNNKRRWLISIGPMSYFVNVLGLYTAYYFHLLSITQINLWSNVVRIHSIYLFIIMAILMWKRGRILWT